MKGTILSLAIVVLMVLGSFSAVGIQINNGLVYNEDDIVSAGMLGASKKALVVGVQDYPGTANDLQFPDDDANDMQAVLTQNGWTDVTKFLNSQATEGAITNKLNEIAGTTTSTSISLFFFSGHGTKTGSGEAICCYDSNMEDTELNNILNNFNGKVVVILDTCYSGGMGPPGFGEVDIDEFITNFIATLGAGNENRVILMACGANEYSYEKPALQNGVFSFFVVEGLDVLSAYGTVTAEDTFDYAQPRTTQYEPNQHPQLYDGDTSAEVPIIGGVYNYEITQFADENVGVTDDWDPWPDLPRSMHCDNYWDTSDDDYINFKFTITTLPATDLSLGAEFKADGWPWNLGPDLEAKNDAGNWIKIKQSMGKPSDFTWAWYGVSNDYIRDNTGVVELRMLCASGGHAYLYHVGVRYSYTPPPPPNPKPDIVENSISFGKLKPGASASATFTVKNVGQSGSSLNWKVESYPSWGTWSFSPSSGTLAYLATKVVTVSFTAPGDKDDFSGSIVVKDTGDGETASVGVSCSTPVSRFVLGPSFAYWLFKLPFLRAFLSNIFY